MKVKGCQGGVGGGLEERDHRLHRGGLETRGLVGYGSSEPLDPAVL